jgi:hypothetical protein
MFVTTPSISQMLICPVQSIRLDGDESRSTPVPDGDGAGGGG